MGNAHSSKRVLVPPLFEPGGLYDRDARADSAYRTAFGQNQRARLFRDLYWAGSKDRDGQAVSLAMRPEGAENVDITVGLHNMHPELHLHCTAPVDSPIDGSFVRIDGARLSACGCALHAASGLGVFLRGKAGDHPLVGARWSGTNAGLGCALGGPGGSLSDPSLAWAMLRLTGGFLFGYEWSRKCSPGVRGYSESVAAGYRRRLDNGRIDAMMELREPRGGDAAVLATSFLYHLTARRDVMNPIEKSDVVGITNYIDIGAEVVTRLAKNPKLLDATNGSSNRADSDFTFAASWQINKNWLVKGRIGMDSVGGVVVFKQWGGAVPSVTCAMSQHLNLATGQVRRGLWFSAENFGITRYDRAHTTMSGKVLREHVATDDEVRDSREVRDSISHRVVVDDEASLSRFDAQHKGSEDRDIF